MVPNSSFEPMEECMHSWRGFFFGLSWPAGAVATSYPVFYFFQGYVRAHQPGLAPKALEG